MLDPRVGYSFVAGPFSGRVAQQQKQSLTLGRFDILPTLFSTHAANTCARRDAGPARPPHLSPDLVPPLRVRELQEDVEAVGHLLRQAADELRRPLRLGPHPGLELPQRRLQRRQPLAEPRRLPLVADDAPGERLPVVDEQQEPVHWAQVGRAPALPREALASPVIAVAIVIENLDGPRTHDEASRVDAAAARAERAIPPEEGVAGRADPGHRRRGSAA